MTVGVLLPSPAPLRRKAPRASEPPALAAVVQALRNVDEFYVPQLKAFCDRNGLPNAKRRAEYLERISDFLLPRTLQPDPQALQRLFEFVDEEKEFGKQHVFLYRLPPRSRGYLDELSDPSRLRRSPVVRPLLDSPDDQPVPLLPAEPTPIHVAFRSPPRRELQLRWVETRLWQQQHKAGRRIELKRHSERAVGHFCLDLETGHGELRLPYLHSNAHRTLREELRRIERWLRDIVDLRRFEPVMVEPILRQLLLSPGRRVVREWRIEWADQGHVESNAEPTFVQVLPLHLCDFFAERAKVDWPVEGDDGGKVRVELDGRLDCASLPNVCEREVLEGVVGSVRQRGRRKINVREVKRAASEDEGLRPALEKIDQQLKDRGRRHLSLREVAEDSRVTEEQIEDASQFLARKFPQVFRLRYRIRCPTTGKVERTATLATRWYKTRAEIPDRVSCSYGTESHVARDNVEAVLDFDPDLRGPQLALRLHRAVFGEDGEERGKGTGHRPRKQRSLRVIAALLSLILVGVLTTFLFLGVGSLFSGEYVGDVLVEAIGIVLSGCVGIIVSVTKAVGKPAEEMIRDALIRLAKYFRPKDLPPEE